jgi:hypothetical protein
MDAAARSVHNMEGGGEPAARLRLRRAALMDPVDSVVEAFLGGDASGGADAPRAAPECGDERCDACGSEAEFKPLRVRCPKAASVVIGVEPTGRVCLEVQVGAGLGIARVLSELEEAERWLRASAHDAAVTPHAVRLDMSAPVRRRVVAADGVPAGLLRRAGVEVRRAASVSPAQQ